MPNVLQIIKEQGISLLNNADLDILANYYNDSDSEVFDYEQ